ncbi:uncharacterized protein [Notamacropus eugenii]|uniref:uncharacterized protein isoform X2 n=1 Tax=Notamacropus eugenii TaxID=9315 RepID=UPI003B6776EA
MRQEGTASSLPPKASAPMPPGQEPGGPSQSFQQDPAGVHWAPAEIRHLLAIMEEPAIRRRLKTVHRNTSVYEDVARRLQQQGYVRHAHQCRTKFKALKVAYKKAHAAVLHSGMAPQGCPFYEEMDRVLQTQVTPASPKHALEHEREQQCDLSYSKWKGGGGENRGEEKEAKEGCPPQPYKQQQQHRPEAEHLDKGEVAELPGDLNPDSQATAEGRKHGREPRHQSGTGHSAVWVRSVQHQDWRPLSHWWWKTSSRLIHRSCSKQQPMTTSTMHSARQGALAKRHCHHPLSCLNAWSIVPWAVDSLSLKCSSSGVAGWHHGTISHSRRG